MSYLRREAWCRQRDRRLQVQVATTPSGLSPAKMQRLHSNHRDGEHYISWCKLWSLLPNKGQHTIQSTLTSCQDERQFNAGLIEMSSKLLLISYDITACKRLRGFSTVRSERWEVVKFPESSMSWVKPRLKALHTSGCLELQNIDNMCHNGLFVQKKGRRDGGVDEVYSCPIPEEVPTSFCGSLVHLLERQM